MSRKLLTLSVATLLMATTLQAQEVKNIIYLIGDGMGLASASMMQLENNYEATIFDHADNIALQKTYSLDNRVTDSAAAGTALATGAKTNNTMLGILPDGTTPQTLMELASEHGKATIEEIESKFGKRVRELVESETEDKRADLPPTDTWRIRKEESLEVLKNADDVAVLIVWLGDKLANMRSMYRDFKVEGVNMWQRFNQKDVTQQAWYYRSIVKLTERLSDTSAWLEYKTLTELVFGKEN